MRYINNEGVLFKELEDLGKELGYEVELVPMGYQSNEKTAELFYSASILIGLHGKKNSFKSSIFFFLKGGAFANMVYCNPWAVIVEINNNNGRDCFAVLAKARRLKYVRFHPKNEFLYQSYKGFNLTKKEISMLKGIVEKNVRESERNAGDRLPDAVS